MKLSKSVLGRALFTTVVLTALAVSAQQAEMKVDRGGAIEAGSTLTFTVKVDKVPNVNVNGVSLSVAPVRPDPDMPGAGGGGGAINAEKTLYKFPLSIPATAHTGTWHVTNLSLNIASAPSKQLKFNDLSFEVREKREVVLPDSGAIEISK